jgi:hypothetical protein
MTSVRSVVSWNGRPDTRRDAEDQCRLVEDAIWRVVGEAAESETSLSVNEQAQKIVSTFPESGFSRDDIKDALVLAAIDAGAVVAVAPPDRSYVPFIEIRSMIRAASVRRSRKGGRAKKKQPSPAEPMQATG